MWGWVGVITILTNIAALLIDILEFAEGLDDVDALASPSDDKLRALMQAVIEHLEGLENVAPVLSLVV